MIGYSGDTGEGPEVTRGLFPAHLHLGWYDATGSRSTVDSGAMNPYPLLEWIKANGGAVTGGSDARYCEAPSPPAPVPSTGQRAWPAPDAPGIRPDLDTGSNEPNPSPVLHDDARVHTRILTAERADPPKRPAPAQRHRTRDRKPRNAPRKEDPRDAPEAAQAIQRPEPPRPPKPQALNRPDPEPPSSQLHVPEPSEPSTFANLTPERPSPGKVEEEPEASSLPPDLQDLLERLIPDLDLAPDRTEKDRQAEEREKKKAREPARRDREEQPTGREPEDHPEPPAERTPPEEEPPSPATEPIAPDETNEPEPELIEPETTVAPETTTGGSHTGG